MSAKPKGYKVPETIEVEIVDEAVVEETVVIEPVTEPAYVPMPGDTEGAGPPPKLVVVNVPSFVPPKVTDPCSYCGGKGGKHLGGCPVVVGNEADCVTGKWCDACTFKGNPCKGKK